MSYVGRGMPEHDARNDEIVARWEAGESTGLLAKHYGLSRSRIAEIAHHTHCRHQLQALGITARAWYVLNNMGLIRIEETVYDFTRDTLIARIQTVDLETIGARYNMGVRTLDALAALVGCPDRFKQRGTGVVRIPRRPEAIGLPRDPARSPQHLASQVTGG